ncbi:MAG: hypothetical protein SVR08_17725 [Spirochaetota bacterium]|nr:hypothetical protein [Spirochaetota bacterium]
MKNILSIIVILFVFVFIFSCKGTEKEMTLHDFLKIEEEVFSSDLTPDSTEAIVSKYGFKVNQYKDFEERIESEPELKAEAGKLRLQMNKELEKSE